MNPVHHSNGLPTPLAIYGSFRPGDLEDVIKHKDGCFKADTVLLLVDQVLPLVPGELHASLS